MKWAGPARGKPRAGPAFIYKDPEGRQVRCNSRRRTDRNLTGRSGGHDCVSTPAAEKFAKSGGRPPVRDHPQGTVGTSGTFHAGATGKPRILTCVGTPGPLYLKREIPNPD